MKTKLDVKDLDWGLPDWLIELLGDRADLLDLLDHHFPRAYQGKVTIVEFFSTEPFSVFTELSGFLSVHEIEFDLVFRTHSLDDTFGIVWRPEDQSIVRKLIRNRRKVPCECDQPDWKRLEDLTRRRAQRDGIVSEGRLQ